MAEVIKRLPKETVDELYDKRQEILKLEVELADMKVQNNKLLHAAFGAVRAESTTSAFCFDCGRVYHRELRYCPECKPNKG